MYEIQCKYIFPWIFFIWQYISDKLFGNRTSKNILYLPGGQVLILRFFYTCIGQDSHAHQEMILSKDVHVKILILLEK